MLSSTTSSKEHRNGERSFHKLDCARSAFPCAPCVVHKALCDTEMRAHEASDMLARRLQHNLANVLNPGVGRLRRAEAEIWGVEQRGPGWAPFSLARSQGNKPRKSATGV
jgi:hypothetical protein